MQFFKIFFSFIVIFFAIGVLTSSFSSLEFFVITWNNSGGNLANLIVLSKYRPVSTFFCSILFYILLFFLLGGFLPYSTMFISYYKLIFFFSFSCWITSFFYLISSERFFSLFITNEFSFFLSLFLFFIEIMGIFINPLSLGIRLYLNVLFGYYIIWYLSMYIINNCSIFYFVASPSIVLELCVFLIQSFLFTYLVNIYFEE